MADIYDRELEWCIHIHIDSQTTVTQTQTHSYTSYWIIYLDYSFVISSSIYAEKNQASVHTIPSVYGLLKVNHNILVYVL